MLRGIKKQTMPKEEKKKAANKLKNIKVKLSTMLYHHDS